MKQDTNKILTYTLANGDEKTIMLENEKLFDLVKWYQDSNSCNSYEIAERIDERVTLYKDTILSIRY